MGKQPPPSPSPWGPSARGVAAILCVILLLGSETKFGLLSSRLQTVCEFRGSPQGVTFRGAGSRGKGGTGSKSDLSGTTGHRTTMVRYRRYLGTRLFNQDTPPSNIRGMKSASSELSCSKWCVLTTINAPTRAMRQCLDVKSNGTGADEDWCTVVVGDKKTPADFSLGSPRGVYLGVAAQEKLQFQTARSLPWNHFGRKNLGYLYAIQHGATVLISSRRLSVCGC